MCWPVAFLISIAIVWRWNRVQAPCAYEAGSLPVRHAPALASHLKITLHNLLTGARISRVNILKTVQGLEECKDSTVPSKRHQVIGFRLFFSLRVAQAYLCSQG